MYVLQDSAGVSHLKKLSKAGMTHVHLLPAFQFAGVDDEKENWKSIGKRISKLRFHYCLSLIPTIAWKERKKKKREKKKKDPKLFSL